MQLNESSAFKHLSGHVGTGQKNVACPLSTSESGCKYVQKDNGVRIADHIMSSHLGFKFPCLGGCGRMFARRDEIKRHRDTVCSICKYCKVNVGRGRTLETHEKTCSNASKEEREEYERQLEVSAGRKKARRENKAQKEAAAQIWGPEEKQK